MNMDHLQSDQGTEFKGVEKTLCETLKVPIIKTSAHSPQTEETDERLHKFDLLNCD